MAVVTYFLDGQLYRVHSAEDAMSAADIIANSVPTGAVDVQIHDSLVYPADALFEGAWTLQSSTIIEDLVKSRAIAHDIRRKVRDIEFEPWDRKATIPSEYAAAEAERELIRQKYAQIQIDIDNASDVSALRTVVLAFIPQ